MILFTKLLLAHLAGDFLLQPDSWVQDKALKKHRSGKLYLHVLIHAAITYLLVWDHRLWLPVAIIALSHFLIDLAKVKLQKANTRVAWFIADQAFHLLVICIAWYVVAKPEFSCTPADTARMLIIFTAAVFLTQPASVIIRTVISQWTPDTLHTVKSSLPDAGKFIGFLERLMVLTFIGYNHWEAVGFLLAAKSVFRFGDLRESQDRKLTEYVLIGTLLSFGIAIAVALLTSAMLNHYNR